MMTRQGQAATESPRRYVKQLVSHLGRKATTRLLDDMTGEVVLDVGRCVVIAQDEPAAVVLRAEAHDGPGLDRVCDVVARHLERFGAREDLTVTWRDASG